MLTFIKNWTLPLAMLAGALGYLAFANFSFLEPTKPFMNSLVAVLTPLLIFLQLLLTFCKVNPRDLMPVRWHGWLLLFQVISCLLMVGLLLFGHMSGTYKEVFEGAMVCLICPTATAAAVITGKLGGSVSALTTYTLLSNILAAIAVPLLFPLVEPHADLSFLTAFLKILSKVFPLLLCPFIAALLIRRFLPKLHLFLLNLHNAAFYLWAIALTIVTAQTFKSLFQSDASIPFRQANRNLLPRPNQRRSSFRTEKYRISYLDVLYLFGPSLISCSRLVCIVAKYHQQLSTLEEEENKITIPSPLLKTWKRYSKAFVIPLLPDHSSKKVKLASQWSLPITRELGFKKHAKWHFVCETGFARLAKWNFVHETGFARLAK